MLFTVKVTAWYIEITNNSLKTLVIKIFDKGYEINGSKKLTIKV
jgi:hypothetical protein